MEKPPPPGISTLPQDRTSSAGAQPKPQSVRVSAPAKVLRSQPKPVSPRVDPIDATKGQRVAPSAPAGVTSKRQDIIELPMPRSKNSERTSAVVRSTDGNTYRFRYLDSQGREFPWTKSLILMVALIEQAKGGDILEVFRAFSLQFGDEDGRQYFPVPEEILSSLRSNISQDSVFGGVGDPQEPSAESESEEEEAPSFFG